MDGISILERIVAEEGSCNWANEGICPNCPLNKMPRTDGKEGYTSCTAALYIPGASDEETNKRYKAAAINKLAELVIESAIRK